MTVYLLTWELNKEKPNYAQARQDLITHLKRYQHIKDAGLDSAWFISTDWSADQVSEDVRKKIDSNDRLIVTKLVTGQHQGWLSQNVWDWINLRL
jgi:hypothetical protein